MKHTDSLTATAPTEEQRGTLTYFYNKGMSNKTVEGWFYLNGGTVIMRKIGGRNHFNLCAAIDIFDFIAYDPETEQLARAFKGFVTRTNNR